MKKLIAIVLTLAMALTLAACGEKAPTREPSYSADKLEMPTEIPEGNFIPSESVELVPEGALDLTADHGEFSVYSMKGPTSMGLVKLMQDSEAGISFNKYTCNMVTAADEVTAAIVSGEADIAMLPANAAAALYNKAGGFSVVAINTLGVLYVVENGDSIQSFADLSGKTVYLTGKGTTPEFGMRYLMQRYGVEDVTLEFKSEAAEVVAALTNDSAAIGVLPQPFVTTALIQNEGLRIALSLTDCWAEVSEDSIMVTGVTLVRNEVLEAYGPQIAKFLEEYAASVEYVNANPAEAAVWIEELGIVGKAAIAQKALPQCNLVCIRGEEMQLKLSGYLQTLYDANPKAVGGAMPAAEFYAVTIG